MPTRDLFSQKQHDIAPLLERAATIYDRLIQIWGNSRHDVTMPMSRLMTDIRAAGDALAAASAESTNLASFDIGALLGTCDDGLDEIARLLTAFNIETKTGMSLTYLAETQSVIDTWNDYMTRYRRTTTSEEIIQWLMPKITKMAPLDVEAEYKRQPGATVLYARYLQHMMDPAKPAAEIAAMLERAKTAAVVDAAGNVAIAPPTRDVWPLQRFGLVPRRQHMTPAELCGHYFAGSKTTVCATIDDFIALAGTKKVSVLMMHLVTSNPVEYNTTMLTDAKAAAGHIFPVTAGVNPAILARFVNVRHSAAPDTTSGPVRDFRLVEHRTAGVVGPWIVVRTLDGAHWDALAASAAADAYVPADVVARILRGPSPRVAALTVLKNNALTGAFRPTADIAENIKAENKGLIATLTNRITGRIIQYIDKTLVPLPTAPAKLEEIIADPKFVEIMNEELLASYSECGISADADPAEFIGTFVAEIDGKIMVAFARALKANMLELGPGAKIFREYTGETLRTRLYNLFVEIIKRSVASAMQTKDNIYEKLLIKDAALDANASAHKLI